MPEIITAIYENGVLRPLSPLPLQEHQTVRIQVLPEGSSNPSVSSLSDAEVLALADSKMDAVQNQRLGELQQRGKTIGLTEAERYELLALLQIYQLGQLRKSEALAEAVQRDLRSSLSP